MEINSELRIKKLVHLERVKSKFGLTELQSQIIIDFDCSIKSVDQLQKKYKIPRSKLPALVTWLESSKSVIKHSGMYTDNNGIPENVYSLSPEFRYKVEDVPFPLKTDLDYIAYYYEFYNKRAKLKKNPQLRLHGQSTK
jgi:hypothetical protein